MAIKLYRGKNIKKIADWRGTCPNCGRTRVKLMWTLLVDGGALKVCKACRNKGCAAGMR